MTYAEKIRFSPPKNEVSGIVTLVSTGADVGATKLCPALKSSQLGVGDRNDMPRSMMVAAAPHCVVSTGIVLMTVVCARIGAAAAVARSTTHAGRVRVEGITSLSAFECMGEHIHPGIRSCSFAVRSQATSCMPVRRLADESPDYFMKGDWAKHFVQRR